MATPSVLPSYPWRDRRDRLWDAAATAHTPLHTGPTRALSAARPAPEPAAAYGFPLAASAPRRARRHTVEFAHRVGLEGVAETAELLVSELMTNALEASRRSVGPRSGDPALAAAPLRLRLVLVHGRLRIEVRDHNPRPPVIDDPDMHEERGRGLMLVETFSYQWGYQRLPKGGKVVWCVVAPPSDDPAR